MPILSKSKQGTMRNTIINEELAKISQELFETDQQDFLSHVAISYQGFLNSSNITEDRAPDP